MHCGQYFIRCVLLHKNLHVNFVASVRGLHDTSKAFSIAVIPCLPITKAFMKLDERSYFVCVSERHINCL